MRVLITGGSGFIGSNSITRLQKLGAYIENFDLSQNKNIQDEKQLAQAVKRKFDVIYHLAGFSGSSESNKNIEKSFKVNTFATVNLCKLLAKYSPKTKLVISSSRLEYGVPQYLPVDENHPTIPTSAYGLSKLAAAQMALIYHQQDNLDVTVFRTSNVYGPHQSARFGGYNVINHFIDLAQENKEIRIFGDGNQLRDYLYIDDLVDAFILALSPRSSGKIYNLGFGQGIKFKEMVQLIVEKVERGKIRFAPWPETFQQVETGSYISDISKIKKELGFSPKIDFKEGIIKTLRSNL